MAGAGDSRGNGRASGSSGSKSGSSASRGRTSRKAARSKKAASPAELMPEGKLYYRIGEVAKITGVKPHVLRYWETEFRWMAPPKSRSKQRLYRRKDIEMILLIKKLLYDERYTIAGARQQLRELGLAKALEGATDVTPVEQVDAAEAGDGQVASQGQSAAAAVAELRSGYRRIRQELLALREVV